MGIKYTYSYIKDFIESNSKCKLISQSYNGSKSKLDLKCECGRLFSISFNHFKSKNQRKCKVCSGNKLDYNIVKEFIATKECKLISDTYINNNTKLDIQCICGDIFKVDFNTFRKGQIRCKSCFWKENKHHNKHTYEYVKSYIENKSNCKLVSDNYIDGSIYLKVICGCGSTFEQSYYNLRRMKTICCNNCTRISTNKKNTHNLDYIYKAVEKKYSGDFKIINMNYIGTRNTTVTIQHKCGYTFNKNVNRLLYTDIKCTECMRSTSIGEFKILKFLNDNKITYIKEYMFDNCNYIRKLRFDVYVPDYNLCIEFDGEQHYKIIDHFGGLEGFVNTKIRDTIKNEYCKNNNITLVRIPYNKIDEVDNILSSYLNKKLIPR
ncbi:MAG: hypothetical protein IJH34_03025 [Romboutsia sp.]|nr:hypothetical protein [Romboutsia sp.]